MAGKARALVRARSRAAWCAVATAVMALPGGYAAHSQQPGGSAAILSNEADGTDWAAYGRTYEASHFSPLDQINDGNVSQLGLVWAYDLPASPSSVAAPLAVGGTVYVVSGGSVVRALDGATGAELWTYDPDVASHGGRELRAAWGVRGLAWWNGKVYTGTMDGRLIALDGKTGRPVWTAQTTTRGDGRYITGAPTVFDGKVIIGHGGADFAPVRGYVTTYDAETGKQLWRFHTVPGNPATDKDWTTRFAAGSWKGQWWKFGGGGTVWNAITYDPKFDRIYIGTGNGSPWNQEIRSPGGGDNLFLCSIVALDAKTGRYLWHYQTNPGETWDYNSAMDIELGTIRRGEQDVPVIFHAPKNGFFYVIDRRDGKLISAEPFAKVNWASRIDMATGRPVENPEVRQFARKPVVLIPGGSLGAHSWAPMAWSPAQKLVYIPTVDLPGVYDSRGIDTKAWRHAPGERLSTGFSDKAAKAGTAPPDATFGGLTAWDPVANKARWTVPLREPLHGGVMATGGNLVFQGLADGRFVARDARTGTSLWEFDAQTGILAQPITYRINGRQYVTVTAGFTGAGGSMGLLLGHLPWDYRTQPRRVLTFAVGGTAKLPPAPPHLPPVAFDDPDYRPDPAREGRGGETFNGVCGMCHGINAVAKGAAPDLRTSAAVADPAVFRAILRDGALLAAGMPRFEEYTEAQRADLRQYLRARAADLRAGTR